jgi:O-antigen/teichoic acid export membrane protein
MRRFLSREALTVVGFSAAQLVLGLGSTRLLTQLADPAALGEYYLYMNLAQWLTLPTAASYLYVWKNWTVARASGQAPAFARSIARGLGWQALVCALGAVLIRAVGLASGSWLMLTALSLVAMGQAVNQALDQVQTLERRRVVAGVLGLLATPVRQLALALGLLVLAASSRGSGSGALLLTQCLYGVGTAALSAWLFHLSVDSPYSGQRSPTSAPPEDLVSLPRFLRFSLPILVTGLALLAGASAERWGLALRAGPDVTALFVQAVAVSTAAVSAATLPISTYFTPIISQAAASSPDDPLGAARHPIRWFVGTSALGLLVATLALAVLSGPITAIFFGPRFHGIAGLLPWAMVGQSLFGLAQAISMIPVAAEATVGVGAAFVSSRAVYLVLLLALPCYGDCGLWFSKCFAFANLLYLAGIVVAALRAMRSRRAAVAVAGVSPS